MDPDQLGTAESALARIRKDPVVGELSLPLPTLQHADTDDASVTIDRLGALIGSFQEEATLKISLTGGDRVEEWSITTGPSGYSVSKEGTGPADLEVTLSDESWARIARGELSPLEVFGRGGMRVQGDINLGRRIVRRLQSSKNSLPSD